jgi:hypothetical protein
MKHAWCRLLCHAVRKWFASARRIPSNTSWAFYAVPPLLLPYLPYHVRKQQCRLTLLPNAKFLRSFDRLIPQEAALHARPLWWQYEMTKPGTSHVPTGTSFQILASTLITQFRIEKLTLLPLHIFVIISLPPAILRYDNDEMALANRPRMRFIITHTRFIFRANDNTLILMTRRSSIIIRFHYRYKFDWWSILDETFLHVTIRQLAKLLKTPLYFAYWRLISQRVDAWNQGEVDFTESHAKLA